MNVYSLCDPAIWDRAQWFGTVFAYDKSGKGPPLMALAFRNKDAGMDVFRSFREHVGVSDKAGLIRVSIVEGDIAGERPGYTVMVGWDPTKAIGADNAATSTSQYVAVVTRKNRMNPEPGSPHLGRFKEEFKKHGQFTFMPAWGQGLQPIFELGIEKYSVNFKRADAVTPQDWEHGAMGRNWIDPSVDSKDFLK